MSVENAWSAFSIVTRGFVLLGQVSLFDSMKEKCNGTAYKKILYSCALPSVMVRCLKSFSHFMFNCMNLNSISKIISLFCGGGGQVLLLGRLLACHNFALFNICIQPEFILRHFPFFFSGMWAGREKHKQCLFNPLS